MHQAAARVAAAADIINLLSLFVPGDDAALSVFTADTIGQLEGAARCEGTPFERIVQAVLVEHRRAAGEVAIESRAETSRPDTDTHRSEASVPTRAT